MTNTGKSNRNMRNIVINFLADNPRFITRSLGNAMNIPRFKLFNALQELTDEELLEMYLEAKNNSYKYECSLDEY